MIYDDGPTGLFFNADKINEFGLADPFALYEASNWTYAKLRDILVAANRQNADGSMFWGASAGGWFEREALIANNAKIIKDLGNDEYTYGMTEPEALETLNWVRSLVLDDKIFAYHEVGGSGGVTRDPAKEPLSTLAAFANQVNAFIEDNKADFRK